MDPDRFQYIDTTHVAGFNQSSHNFVNPGRQIERVAI